MRLGRFSFFLGEPFTYVPRTASNELPVGRTYVCKGGERLDQVAYLAYGIQAGAVEALLIANPGLASQPYTLPAELAIVLPDLVIQKARQGREVPLWS